jgi:hypothetical protein
MVVPEPTSAGRCGLKLQLMWQRVDARPAPCFDLEFVCGVSGIQGTDKGSYRWRNSLKYLLHHFCEFAAKKECVLFNPQMNNYPLYPFLYLQ